MRALLIEDTQETAQSLKTLIEANCDFTNVVIRETLTEGLAELEQGKYGVCILDLNLPDSTGLETLDILVGRHPGLPVVAVSGFEYNAVERGAQDFLLKSEITIKSLFHAITMAISRHKVRGIFTPVDASIRSVRRRIEEAHNDLRKTGYL